MAHLVTATFKDNKAAGDAVARLKEAGYTDEISLIAMDKNGDIKSHKIKESEIDGAMGAAAIGGVAGGLAGLLAGAGLITLPGVGTLLVAGPLAATWGLTGAAGGALTGGLVGALVDVGISENTAENYMDAIRRGEVLIAVKANHDSEPEIREIFDKHGAHKHETQHQTL